MWEESFEDQVERAVQKTCPRSVNGRIFGMSQDGKRFAFVITEGKWLLSCFFFIEELRQFDYGSCSSVSLIRRTTHLNERTAGNYVTEQTTRLQTIGTFALIVENSLKKERRCVVLETNFGFMPDGKRFALVQTRGFWHAVRLYVEGNAINCDMRELNERVLTPLKTWHLSDKSTKTYIRKRQEELEMIGIFAFNVEKALKVEDHCKVIDRTFGRMQDGRHFAFVTSKGVYRAVRTYVEEFEVAEERQEERILSRERKTFIRIAKAEEYVTRSKEKLELIKYDTFEHVIENSLQHDRAGKIVRTTLDVMNDGRPFALLITKELKILGQIKKARKHVHEVVVNDKSLSEYNMHDYAVHLYFSQEEKQLKQRALPSYEENTFPDLDQAEDYVARRATELKKSAFESTIDCLINENATSNIAGVFDGKRIRRRTVISTLDTLKTRRCPIHCERPVIVKWTGARHHFVILQHTTLNGEYRALVQHLAEFTFSTTLAAILTARVKTEYLTDKELRKLIEKGFWIVEHDVIDSAKVYQRAKNVASHKGYQLGYYNCESYVEYLITGHPHSSQTHEEATLRSDFLVSCIDEFQNLFGGGGGLDGIPSSAGGSLTSNIIQRVLRLTGTAAEDAAFGLRNILALCEKCRPLAYILGIGALPIGIAVAVVVEWLLYRSAKKMLKRANLSRKERQNAMRENRASLVGGLVAIGLSVAIGFVFPGLGLGLIGIGFLLSIVIRILFRFCYRVFILNRRNYFRFCRGTNSRYSTVSDDIELN